MLVGEPMPLEESEREKKKKRKRLEDEEFDEWWYKSTHDEGGRHEE